MNAFAKVLVVFILVLSVGFAVSQMMLHSKRINYSAKLAEAQTKIQDLQGELEEETKQLADLTAKYDTDINRLQDDLGRLKTEETKLNEQIKDVEAEKLKLHENARNLAAVLDKQQDIIKAKEGEISKLRTIGADLTKRLNEHQKKIGDMNATILAKEEKIKQLLASVQEWKSKHLLARKERDSLHAIVERLSALDIRVPLDDVKAVDAKVARVDREHGAIVINKGKQDGILINYPFVIYRDRDFIAKAIVLRVADNLSFARIEPGSKAEGKEVNVGDDCTTRIRVTELPLTVTTR